MILAFDIEADNLLDDLTKIHCICAKDLETGECYSYNNQTGEDTIRDGLWQLEGADVLVGHNIIDFDIAALKKVYPLFKPKAKLYDTLVASRAAWPNILDLDLKKRIKFPDGSGLKGTYSLKAWGYRLGILKGTFGETNDWSVWTQEMENYCEQDVLVTEALYNRIQKENLPDKFMDLELDFAEIIQLQIENGWALDVEKAKELYATLSIERQKIVDEIQQAIPPTVEMMKTAAWYEWTRGEQVHRAETKGEILVWAKENDIRPRPKISEFTAGPLKEKHHPFNPGSRDQIASYLCGQGWKPTKFTDGGKPKVDETTLKGLKFPNADKFQRYLMIQKRLSQLAEGDTSILECVKDDGRVYGRVNTYGTVTGRCAHYRPNVAQTPANRAPFGEEFRELYKASEGFKMLGFDASGLELRCLAHYLKPFDKGIYEKEVTEGDIHTKNQLDAGLPDRDKAKTFI